MFGPFFGALKHDHVCFVSNIHVQHRVFSLDISSRCIVSRPQKSATGAMSVQVDKDTQQPTKAWSRLSAKQKCEKVSNAICLIFGHL